MRKVEPWKKWTFVGSLALIAFFINSRFAIQKSAERARQARTAAALQQNREVAEKKREAQAAAEEAKAKEEQARREAAEKHERFLRRYVNAGFSRKSGHKTLALAAASERGNFNQALGRELIRRFSSDGAEIYSSFFTPRFFTDGLFSSVFSGSTEVASKLNLSQSVDGLLLALEQVTYSTNSGLNNLITANVRLDVLAAPVSGNGQNQSWGFTANGAGFHPTDALLMAEERLIKQISTDTKMSLNDISQLQQTQ